MQYRVQNGFLKNIQLLFALFLLIVFSNSLALLKDNPTLLSTMVYSIVLLNLKKFGSLSILFPKTMILIESRLFIGRSNKTS